MRDISLLMACAYKEKIVIPGFNIRHLSMVKPIVSALIDTESFGLIEVARLECEKFNAGSFAAVRDTYEKCKDERFTGLHLDHIPVIDEDRKSVDYLAIIREAIDLGYESVMVDGSRLSLEENIAATRQVVELAHAANVPVEGELGSVVGHEQGPMPPYEELFASKQGFTDLQEAGRFVKETNVDWLSVAFGSVHGAISAARKNEKKIEARLDIEHLRKLQSVAPIPMVLHGGSGIQHKYVEQAIKNGISKINIGTNLWQVYEKFSDKSADDALEAIYNQVCYIVKEELKIAGMAGRLVDLSQINSGE